MSKKRLLRLWKFFAWADKARWNGEQSRCNFKWLLNRCDEVWKEENLKICTRNLKPNDIILAHWLTYIFDYAMPAKKIWERAFPVMAYIAYRFRKGSSTQLIMKNYYKSSSCEFSIGNHSFKHRFLKAHGLNKKVERTLITLESPQFCRSLIAFCFHMSENAKEENWIRRVACGLYALTYDERLNEPWHTLLDISEFDHYYKAVPKIWHKRLWASFRDYLKGFLHQKYFVKALEEYGEEDVLNRWINPEPYLYQLELPGDIWNIRFYGKCVKPLLLKIGDLPKATPKVIRRLYELYKDETEESGLYPEQFDVTFDFARICEEGLCQICPLSQTGSRMLCIGGLEVRDKYCPVLASTCRYYVKCEPKECPVFNGQTTGICLTRTEKQVL